MLLNNIGFDSNKIVKKYNFVPDAQANLKECKIEGIPDKYVVFYGRIGKEKGIEVLMQAWNKIKDIPLVVMGSGPIENEFAEWAKSKDNVYFLGYTQHEKCMSIVKAGEFVVFPSIWYEGCSMVEIDSQSLGKPLVATDLGFSSEAIMNGYNGLKFKLGDIDEFVNSVYKLWNDSNLVTEMSENARLEYENKYRPDSNFEQISSIYNDILGGI